MLRIVPLVGKISMETTGDDANVESSICKLIVAYRIVSDQLARFAGDEVNLEMHWSRLNRCA